MIPLAQRAPVGQSRRRVEDARFLTGHGRYVADLPAQAAAHAFFIRSPHAHARIRRIDPADAPATPGFLALVTAADLADLGPIPCQAIPPTVGPIRIPLRSALAADTVRYAGEPVACLLAETAHAARDAAERILVDYDPLPAVTEAAAALAETAPQLWPDIPANRAYVFEKGDRAATDAAFAAAPHTITLTLVNNRLIVAPLEPRAALATHDPAPADTIGTFHLTYSGAQVHGLRDALADTVFRCPRDRIRLSCPDVGGGFGVKNALYPEYILLLWAARRLARPVRWTADAAEDFLALAHGRDNLTTARLALAADGRFLALSADTVANLGAAMSSAGPAASTTAPGNAIGSGYRFDAIHLHVRGAYTNTTPLDAYRGAGKPEVNYLLERLIDAAARQLGRDPTDLRRQNLITAFPHRTPIATTIDGGQFAQNIDPALDAADVANFPARRAASQASGRLRGLGITCFLETARGAPDEGVKIRFDADGRIALLPGTQSNGQGHETTFPQLAAALFGLPAETFRYLQADTFLIRAGNGHGGARSLHQAGAAMVAAADQVLAKARPIAARLLQADPATLTYEAGAFHTATTNIPLLDLARAEPGALDTDHWNKLDQITFPNGVHVAEIELDPETGATTLCRYTGVDDYGTVLNPLLTIGQVQGGLAQGIGQALLERVVYDPASGQLLSGSHMDYCLPRAADLPDLEIHLRGTPTTANPLGAKGAGQAGAIAAPPAILSALLDALAPLGVTHLDMPATPETIWRALHPR